ncbi:MAG: cyclase family protein [Salibacteraceae bacterium]
MQISIKYNNQTYQINLNEFFDISIPMGGPKTGVKAWYLDEPIIEPVTDGDFIGEVAQGSSVNFRNITFNPHAHVTHTESMGHIHETIFSVNKNLKQYYFFTELISVQPEKKEEDLVITKHQVQVALKSRKPKAVVIRTLPNGVEKLKANYSHTNPTYLDSEAAAWLNEIGVEHLLIDTPSVDREQDEGELKAHKAFWGYPGTHRLHCTISEFVFIKNEIEDGTYFMNLQTAPIENDATPSRPILHKMTLTN